MPISLTDPFGKLFLSRRRFLAVAAGASVGAAVSCRSRPGGAATAKTARLFFVSEGRTALVNADGTGLRYLDLSAPGQAAWQPAGFFSDGRRVVFLSMEKRRDGPGRPFEKYYTQTPTKIWIYDLDSGKLEEIVHRERKAVFVTPQLLLSNGRILVQVAREGAGQIFNVNLDGTGAREFTRPGEGFPYGLSLSPDGRRVAFHLATGGGYQIWTSDTEGGNRARVAAEAGHLFFGPVWSPDGAWLAYQDCRFGQDPGHDWSDLAISRPGGGERQYLTSGQAMWFAATYGDRTRHGGGSNIPAWTRDGRLLYPRRLTGARAPWRYQEGRPDTDHFNREFKPGEARGGTEICRLDPATGRETALTKSDPPGWDFRASESPDGKWIVFCRAATGELPSIWVMPAEGGSPRRIASGLNGAAADHPRWLPTPG